MSKLVGSISTSKVEDTISAPSTQYLPDREFGDLKRRYLSRAWGEGDTKAVTYLDEFLAINNHCRAGREQCKATFDIITQFDSASPEEETIRTHHDLERYLFGLRANATAGRISLCTLVAENICPHSICQLGMNFDIRPLFWATHFEKARHTQDEDVDSYLPPVPSGSREFLNIQYFEPRELEGSSEPLEPLDTIEMVDRPLESFQNCESGSATAKGYTSDVKREVQILPQRDQKNGDKSDRVAMIPGPLSVWTTQQGEAGAGRDVMVVLIDPIAPRLEPKANFHLDMNRQKIVLKPRERITHYLTTAAVNTKSNFSMDMEAKPSGGMANPQLRARAYRAIRRLISDQWRLTQGYVARDMDLIQQKTEEDIPDFQVSRKLLKDLFAHRQKCLQYSGQINETIEELKKWDTDGVDRYREAPVSRELGFAGQRFIEMSMKTETQLHLLTALTSVREAQQGLEESHGVTRLTRIATIYLPFSTIAAVLAMPDQYAPGRRLFWVYWAASAILAILVITALVNYERVLVPLAGVWPRLRARWARTGEEQTVEGRGGQARIEVLEAVSSSLGDEEKQFQH